MLARPPRVRPITTDLHRSPPGQVRCRVCLEPLAELLAHQAYEQRQGLRQTLAARRTALVAEQTAVSQLRKQAGEREAQLAALKQQVAAEEEELLFTARLLQQRHAAAMKMRGEISLLRKQLGAA